MTYPSPAQGPPVTIIDHEATARVIAALEAEAQDLVHAVCLVCRLAGCGTSTVGMLLLPDAAPLDCTECIVADEANPGTCGYCGSSL